MNDIELRERLQALGHSSIDPVTVERHERRIAAAAAMPRRRRRFGAVSLAAAGLVGFLAGSTGLAMADALPDGAQQIAHVALGAVKIDVPAGKEGKRGPCVSAAAKIAGKDAKKAAMDACPKGGGGNGKPAGNDNPGAPQGQGGGNGKHAGDPCHGRPPWAGRMTKEERAAAKQAASRDACPPDADEADEADEAGDDSVVAPEAPETTAPTVVTTAAPADTTVAPTADTVPVTATTGPASG